MNTRAPQTGGLQLPKDVGVSQTEADAIANEWNTLPSVDAMLHARGIHPNVEPAIAYAPVTVAQLLAADTASYTTLFACQLNWYNYVVRILADVRAELLQVEGQMGDIERKKRTHFRELNQGLPKAERMGATEMEDAIGIDPVWHTLSLHKQELMQAKLKIDAWSDGLERNWKTVSRQIENRRAEGQAGDRSAHMPAHAAGRWTGRPGE